MNSIRSRDLLDLNPAFILVDFEKARPVRKEAIVEGGVRLVVLRIERLNAEAFQSVFKRDVYWRYLQHENSLSRT